MQRGVLIAGLLASAAGVCAVGTSVPGGPASAAETSAGTREAAIRDVKGVEKAITAIEEEMAQVGRQVAQLEASGPLTANQSSAETVLFGELLADEGAVPTLTESLRNPFIEELVPKRKLPTSTSTSSFVVTRPESLAAAAGELAAIRDDLSTARATASVVETGLQDTPAVSNEVLAAVGALFSGQGEVYREISGQAVDIHNEFDRVLHGGAASYPVEGAGVVPS